MRALFLVSYVPEAAAVMRGWRASGHEVAGVWNPRMLRSGPRHRDARLGFLAPRWSMIANAKRAGAPVRIVPPLATWEGRMDALAEVKADVLISVYFNFRIPADMLEIFGDRAVNFHPAPLPRYRGQAPIHMMVLDRTILRDGAMTLHVMTPALDEGPVIGSEPIPFRSDKSLLRYHLNAAKAAESLTRRQLQSFLSGQISAVPQHETEGGFSRLAEVDIGLRSSMEADEIRWRCETFGAMRALPLDDSKPRIVGFDRHLGAPTGRGHLEGFRHLDMDCRDGRIRLLRKMPWSSPLRKLRNIAIQATEPAD